MNKSAETRVSVGVFNRRGKVGLNASTIAADGVKMTDDFGKQPIANKWVCERTSPISTNLFTFLGCENCGNSRGGVTQVTIDWNAHPWAVII